MPCSRSAQSSHPASPAMLRATKYGIVLWMYDVTAPALAKPSTCAVVPLTQQAPPTSPELPPAARKARCPRNQEITGILLIHPLSFRSSRSCCSDSCVPALPNRLGHQERGPACGRSPATNCALNSGLGSPRSPEAMRARASSSSSPVEVNSPRETMLSMDALSSSYFRSSGIFLTYPGPQGFHCSMLKGLDGPFGATHRPGGFPNALLLPEPHHYHIALVPGQFPDKFEQPSACFDLDNAGLPRLIVRIARLGQLFRPRGLLEVVRRRVSGDA